MEGQRGGVEGCKEREIGGEGFQGLRGGSKWMDRSFKRGEKGMRVRIKIEGRRCKKSWDLEAVSMTPQTFSMWRRQSSSGLH